MMAEQESSCKHCGRPIVLTPNGSTWTHEHRRGDTVSYLGRCNPELSRAQYGLNADPVGKPCTGACRDAPRKATS